MGKHFFSMAIDGVLHRRLKLYAVENGVSMCSLIERGLDLVLNPEQLAQEASKTEENKEN